MDHARRPGDFTRIFVPVADVNKHLLGLGSTLGVLAADFSENSLSTGQSASSCRASF